MCGGAGSWASTTVVLSASTGSTIFSEDLVVTPLDTANRQVQWIVGKKTGHEIIHIYVV